MTEDLLPEKFGRYEVQAKIGEGSMGRVYRAFDPLAQRTVGVKTPRPEILTAETAADYLHRFEREARAAGSLSHPHIVTIYDVGENYFVMELLEGVTAQALLAERGKLGLEETLRILYPVADALDHAHSRGIVHRDIKPANIVVLPDGRPKIMDFGVAHFESSVVTAKGEFLGSPSYMAPEQIARSEATALTDLFSLAVVAYELLTGQKPFMGDSITAIIYRVVNEDPRPPTALNEALPARHDAVFARALAKDPAVRFPTATAFLDALAGKTAVEPMPPPLVSPGFAAPAVAVGDVETHDLPATPRAGPPGPARIPHRGAALGLGLGLLGALALAWTLSPRLAAVAVETQPPGARVLLDGAPRGTSPLSLGDLPPGAHTVRVTRDGFAPAEVSLDLSAGKQPVPVRFKLQPVAAILSVVSAPAGAAVIVDDEPVGTTPISSLPLAPGPHSLRVTREGFRPWTRALDVKPGEEMTLDAPLERLAGGRAGPQEGRPGGWVAEGDLVELGPGVEPPRKLSGSPAEYPQEAARLKLHGSVVVEMIVTEQGEVRSPRVVRSAGELLDRAVLDVVRRFKFEPAQKNGVKVRVRYTYRQQFDAR